MGLLTRPLSRIVRAHAVDESSLSTFGCDVSFIGEEGQPIDALIEQARDLAPARKLNAIVRRLREQYDAGEMTPHPAKFGSEIGATLPKERADALLAFLNRLNSALFQQQTVAWLADCGLKVRVYGAGWDQNPAFASLHHGVVENDSMRRAIWLASRINLAAHPYGAASPSVLDGIAAGGFFLMRFCPADVVERIFPPIAQFCREQAIESNDQLRQTATPMIKHLVSYVCRTYGMDVLNEWPEFVPQVLSIAASGQLRSAAAVWSSYPSFAFSSRDELLSLCTRYLYDGQARQQLNDRMRSELSRSPGRVRVQVDPSIISAFGARQEAAA